MAGPGNIVITVGAKTAEAIGELNKVNKSLGSTMTSSEKMGATLNKAAIPAAAALAAMSYAAVDFSKAAAEDEKAATLLAGALKRTTGATDAQVASTEAWIGKLEASTGIADDELRPALAKLATTTHDVGKAQDALTLALDISAATGKDLQTVSFALEKAYGGQTAALKKLVPDLDKAALKTGDMDALTKQLADTFGGAMSESAGTAAGQYQILQVQMDNVKETLGYALLPFMEDFVKVLQKATAFVQDHTDAVLVIGGAIATLAAAVLAANAALKLYKAAQLAVQVATKAWTAIQWLLNAALSANPIGLVVVAIAALTAGIILAYKHSETFRNICTAAFNAVKVAVDALGRGFTAVWNAAKAAFDWIKSHWTVAALALGPVGVAIIALAKNFDKVKAAGTAAFDAIRRAIESVVSWINRAIDAVHSLIGWLSNIKVPSIKIPGIHAAGYGYGYGPAPMAAASAAGAGGITVNVYGAIDPEGTARTIRRVLEGHERRMGRRVL